MLFIQCEWKWTIFFVFLYIEIRNKLKKTYNKKRNFHVNTVSNSKYECEIAFYFVSYYFNPLFVVLVIAIRLFDLCHALSAVSSIHQHFKYHEYTFFFVCYFDCFSTKRAVGQWSGISFSLTISSTVTKTDRKWKNQNAKYKIIIMLSVYLTIKMNVNNILFNFPFLPYSNNKENWNHKKNWKIKRNWEKWKWETEKESERNKKQNKM